LIEAVPESHSWGARCGRSCFRIKQGSFKFLGFDGQGGLRLIGGLVIGLIALYSFYDYVNFFSSTIHLNQQWGV